MSTESFQPDVVTDFGGLCTIIDRSDLPKGISPYCRNVSFVPGVVRSRDGFAVQLTNTSGVQNIASFLASGIRRLLVWYRDGTLRQEYPEGTETNVLASYGTNQIMKACTLYGRKYMAFSDGRVPTSPPLQWDGTTLSRVTQPGPVFRLSAAPTVTFNAGNASNFTGGYRDVMVHFLTANGYQTRPAMIVSGFNGTGSPQKKIDVNNIPVGPAGTTARVISISLSQGTSAQTVLPNQMFCDPATMWIGENTSTSLLALDVSETTLANGIETTALWNRQILGPPIGFCAYGGRLVSWGNLPDTMLSVDRGPTSSQANSLYFDAVPDGTAPTGWIVGHGNATQVALAGGVGNVLKLTGNFGTGVQIDSNATYGMGIGVGLRIGQFYGLRLRMKKDPGLTSGTLRIRAGSNVVDSSLSVGSIGTDWTYYTFPADGLAVFGPAGGTPAIQLDDNSLNFNTGGLLYVDEIAWIPVLAGDIRSTGWASIGGPEDFDLTRSPFQVSPGDGQALVCCFELSGNLYAAKEHSLWATGENGGDPVTWTWQNVSEVCGSASVHGVGKANKFVILVCRSGAYYFDGGQPQKISQDLELGTDPVAITWRSIDWSQAHRMWVTVDPEKMQFRIGAPTDPTVDGCNMVFVGDYVEGFASASIIAGSSYGTATGGRGLKWSLDTISATCGEQAERDNGSSTVFLGGRLTSSNDVPKSDDFGFPTWSTLGTTPTVTGAQPDAMGGNTATRWQFIAGSNVLTLALATVPPLGAYYTVTIRLKLNTGASMAATIKSPGTAYGLDFPITITNVWQRFTATWGPMNGVLAEKLVIDFGAGASDILIGSAQIQAGAYDQGECVTGGAPLKSVESGYVAKPILGQTYDFFQPIFSTYEMAPFAAPIGRSTFGKLIIRGRGSGQLVTQWVRPDGTLENLRGGQYPLLNPNPLNDWELDSNATQSQLGVRFSNTTKNGWWLVQKVALLIKPSEYAQYRGRG